MTEGLTSRQNIGSSDTTLGSESQNAENLDENAEMDSEAREINAPQLPPLATKDMSEKDQIVKDIY